MTNGSKLTTRFEARWDTWRDGRKARSKLVRPDQAARPGFGFFGDIVRLPEMAIRLLGFTNVVVVAAITYFIERRTHRPITDGGSWRAWALLLSGGVGWLVLVCDLGSYRPRLFAACAGDSDEFFIELGKLSGELVGAMEEIQKTPARRWAHVREHQSNLVLQANEYLLLGDLRARITLRVMFRIAATVISLAIIGLALAKLHGGLVTNTGPEAGLGKYGYFSAIFFFTVGFGDVHPNYDWLGYAYTAFTLFTTALMIYFFLTDIVASQNEFRTNLRLAAESYVVRASPDL